MAQIWAGANWGGMFIPRVGQEVVVEFLDGNPDRPIITGCVYNANQGVPYPLPDNKTRSAIKTHSSTGSGNNELRFEDKAGSEEIFFQAQKDYNKVVLNNETVKITQDTTTTVEKGNRSVTVSQGNDGLTVSTGNHTITVSAGNSTIKAGQSILLQVGGNSVRIDTDGITLVGSKVSIMAQESMSARWRPVDDAAGRADRDQLSGAMMDTEFTALLERDVGSLGETACRVLAEHAPARSAIPSRAIEAAIAAIDRRLSEQFNLILHHADFQRMEATWRGLSFLVDGIETELHAEDQGAGHLEARAWPHPAQVPRHRLGPEPDLQEDLRGGIRAVRRRAVRRADRRLRVRPRPAGRAAAGRHGADRRRGACAVHRRGRTGGDADGELGANSPIRAI